MPEEIKKSTLVCRLTENPDTVICDIYTKEGKHVATKVLPKEKVKELFE